MVDSTMTMHSRRTATWLITLLFALAASGCTAVQMKLREPGQQNKAFPEDVAIEYDCDRRPLPFFQIEQNQLLPDKLTPGERFNHRSRM